MRAGNLGLCTFASQILRLWYPFLHGSIKINPTVANQYCDWPDVEIRSGIEEWVLLELSENQEMTENLGFDDKIDILLYQNGTEKINEDV